MRTLRQIIVNYAIISLTLVGLAGCNSLTRSTLAKTTRQEVIQLDTGISYIRPWMHRIEQGALPGIYKAEGEDTDGTYYFGNGRSIWEKNAMLHGNLARMYVGGIYLPKNPDKAPQLFYIFEKDVHTVDDINAYVIQRIVMSPTLTPNVGVGVNVAGAAVGGALVNAIIDSAVGEIHTYPEIKDGAVVAKIRAGVRTNVSDASDALTAKQAK